MTRAPGLFEYLAVPVMDHPSRSATHLTHADDDEYDAPQAYGPGLTALIPDLFDGTLETRQDHDTYDDDNGLSGLAVPAWWADSTVKTGGDSDTYDEDLDVGSSGIPIALYFVETSITKVENETYDDDDSMEGLGIPSS